MLLSSHVFIHAHGFRLSFIDITAAMMKVSSPNSVAKIMKKDEVNPAKEALLKDVFFLRLDRNETKRNETKRNEMK